MIEEAAREAGDAERLSTALGRTADVVREAHYHAGRSGKSVIQAADIEQAVASRIRRASRVQDRLDEEIARGTLLIDTAGERVGQVNALAVSELGDFAFARPSRVTARVALGSGKVLDIERAAELAGPLHSKGVLILSGFLAAQYVDDRPLSLSATLVFEQSYAEIEGDSASSAELYALLSALAEAPLRQSLAVTGSVNQHGEVQAIGAVNEKVEGFFRVCEARGLSGEQGVLIPAANAGHLMLRPEVVEACEAGRFAVYPVARIDQGLALLTGMPAGERDAQGEYPEGTVNHRIRARLLRLAALRRELGNDGEETED